MVRFWSRVLALALGLSLVSLVDVREADAACIVGTMIAGVKPTCRRCAAGEQYLTRRGGCPVCCTVPDRRNCHWRGTAPFCAGECHRNEIAYRSFDDPRDGNRVQRGFGDSCWTGEKVLCCRLFGSVSG